MKNSLNPQKEIQATTKEWLGLVVLALPCMLYSMDLTVLNLALPQLSLHLKPSASQLLWIVDIYGFFVAGSLITMGNLGDRIGRRKMLLIGGFIFALTSCLAAFSTSAEMLILMRALQGMAGATLAPSTLSLIRVLFKNPHQRAQAIGLWGASFSVGALLGPVVGGFLIEHFWWGSVFLINIPIMVLLLILGPKILPEYKNSKSETLDLSSAGLSLVAILTLIFGLKHIAEIGLSTLSMGSMVVGFLLGLFFIQRQKKLKNPLVDLNLFKNKIFNYLIVTNSLTMFVFFGTFIFNSQILQLVMGLSPMQAGLWSLPSTVGTFFSGIFAPKLTRYIRPAYLMSIGLVVGSIGFLIAAQVKGINDLYLMTFATVLYSMSCVPVLLFTTNMLVNSAPAEKAGSTAALSETGNELGGATGIALLGSVGTFIFQKNMTGSLAQIVSPEIRIKMSSTLANALEFAQQIKINDAALANQLVEISKNSYLMSFKISMLIAAVILFFLSALVIFRLKNIQLENES